MNTGTAPLANRTPPILARYCCTFCRDPLSAPLRREYIRKQNMYEKEGIREKAAVITKILAICIFVSCLGLPV